MADIIFNKDNYADLVPKSSWTLNLASVGANGVVTIQPNGYAEFTISQSQLKSASKYINLIVHYDSKPDKTFNNLQLRYIGSDLIENNLVPLNRDIDTSNALYETSAQIETKGREFISAKVTLRNNSAQPIAIHGVEFYLSQDVDKNQIVDVVQQSVISADTAMANNCWVDALKVNTVETNIFSKNILSPYIAHRDFIYIKDRTINFTQEQLHPSEVEQLEIEINGEMTPVWWTAIDDHPQAYTYVTTTRPTTFVPELTPAQELQFAMNVRKVVSSRTDLRFHWMKKIVKGVEVSVPAITFGDSDDINAIGVARIISDDEKTIISRTDTLGNISSLELLNNGQVRINGANHLIGVDIALDGSEFTAKYTQYNTKFNNIQYDSEGRISSMGDSRGFSIDINRF